VFVDADESGGIRQSILLTTYGLLLPILSGEGTDASGLPELIGNLRAGVRSVMGIAAWVETIEEYIPLLPTARIEYYLMVLARGNFAPTGNWPPGVRVRAADAADSDALYPLQKGYEHEEVIINPAYWSSAQCMRLLKASLREEIVYVAELQGKPVSKAGTNARGYDTDQIGGVYTVPDERGKGLAGAVMDALLREVFARKSAACLFVKKTNAAAVSLYTRLGFKTVSDFLISYYGL
jgi:predicted GNAT family acetyltransferase